MCAIVLVVAFENTIMLRRPKSLSKAVQSTIGEGVAFDEVSVLEHYCLVNLDSFLIQGEGDVTCR